VVLLAATVGCTPPPTTHSPTPEVGSGSGNPALNRPSFNGSAAGDPLSPDTEVTDADLADTEATDAGLTDTEVVDTEVVDTEIADTDLTNTTTDASENAPSDAEPDLAQHLPITAQTILGGEEIFLEVAETPTQQALGLMYRDALPDDRGMVFPMNRPRPVRFWMMNVPVALDMLFVYQGQIQYIAAEVPPCPIAPCPTYGPDNQLVDHVIELRAGRSAELGLQVGDAVEIIPLE
jgi:uncharacterized protein